MIHIRRVLSFSLLFALAAPAAAQFDPAFDHLKCYKIRGQVQYKRFQLRNQFGHELAVKMVPRLLCLPTHKRCCDPADTAAGCIGTPCPPNPEPAVPVRHFKCYKTAFRRCVDDTCTTIVKPAKDIVVDLTDQLGRERVPVGPPQLLCTPVLKEVVQPTTTTVTVPTTTQPTVTTTSVTNTTVTSTTNPPTVCSGPDGAGLCQGPCPPGLACLATATGCACVDAPLGCSGAAPDCNGLCANVLDVCAPSQDGTGACVCQPRCGDPPQGSCGGVCPPGSVCGNVDGHCFCQQAAGG